MPRRSRSARRSPLAARRSSLVARRSPLAASCGGGGGSGGSGSDGGSAATTVHPGESIQAAVDAAAPGDTIEVLPGDYIEPGTAEAAVRITKSLQLVAKSGPGIGEFDRRLKFEFDGANVTSDAGLLAFCELDDALGLTAIAGESLTVPRTGLNSRTATLPSFGSRCSAGSPV